MNIPQLITPENVMTEKPLRLKGCRYHLLYSGYLSKEIYYNWFRQNLMPRRDAQLALFIANININGAQFTKVIFKFNVTIDWKSIDKLDFPIGTGKARPEVRPIYKSNWSAEYMNMVKQDPNTYPPLEDVNIVSARSPKRIKGVSVAPTPIVTVSIPKESVAESTRITSTPIPVLESPTTTPVPESSSIKNQVQDVISEMGILNKLNSLEELIKSYLESKILKSSLPCEVESSPIVVPEKQTNEIFGIFIEGDASDLVLSSDIPNIILENKSVISIRPVNDDTKHKAIHTTKNSMDKIINIIKTYGIWFRKYQDKIVMKNSDLMLITLYIGV